MTLIVHELMSSPLEQKMTPSKNTILHAVRPHIYRHNFASGSLKVQVFDDSDTMIAESEVINIADIETANFFHGYVRFNISAYLKKHIQYTFKLVGTAGYSFSEGAYIGWCTDFDLQKYPRDITPPDLLSCPLDVEIWERTTK